MKEIFNFGEEVDGFDIRVLNDRELRAGAGILFLLSIIAFMNAWLLGIFLYIKIVVIIFFVDFFIRVLINPQFSPSLILGRLIVRNQKPEYVGAIQKKFAWGLGLIFSIIMIYTLIISNIIGPLNMILCITCLILLFFESVFGICLGCKIYNFFSKNKAQLCPGGNCEIEKKEEIQKVNLSQILVLILFMIFTYFSFGFFSNGNTDKDIKNTYNVYNINKDSDCVVPDWAIKIGHKDMWKLHNGCK